MNELDLRDRLGALADRAPERLPADDLWARGRRRQQWQRVGTSVLVAAVLLALGAVAGLLHGTARTPNPADLPFRQLHLPITVHAPNEWSEGTARSGPPGRLAVVSLADRAERSGLTGKVTSLSAFGVSAADGSAHFLDLKGLRSQDLGGQCLVLSPDGTEVGYCRWSGKKLLGWAVYDTVSGRTTMLADPDNAEIVGSDFSDLVFSGDSRYLETNYSRAGSDDSKDHDFVVWDVETGRPTTVEKAGHYYFPEIGSGPSGIVWSRHRATYRTDPASGTTTRVDTAPYEVIQASYGPGGRSLAMITFGPTKKAEWRVYAGGHRVAGIENVMSIIGWRDTNHVVVVSTPSTNLASFVDVRTGKVTGTVRLHANALMTPSYASDLWANALVPGKASPAAPDPRRDVVWAGVGVGAVVLGAVGLLVLRRRRG